MTERVQRLAPYLKLDRDPYLVLADGRLQWMVDGYTTTDRFPYAQLVQEILSTPGAGARESDPPRGPAFGRRLSYNYIRNSVKAVVDAYDGSVTLYVADAEDPLVRAYAGAFPQLYRPLETMPPPCGPCAIRRTSSGCSPRSCASTTSRTGLLQREDVWATPFETIGGQRAPVEPLRADAPARRDGEEFLLMLPSPRPRGTT